MFAKTLTRKMWTTEARAASAAARKGRAAQHMSNTQSGAYSTHESALPASSNGPQPESNVAPNTVPPQSHGNQRTTAPEYAANGGGIDHVAVANTIMKQYGGNRFRVMTGASNFTASKSAEGHPHLTFKIPRVKGITHIKTVLKPDDTYSVHMIGVHGSKVTEKHVAHGMHADQLEAHFTHHTGLNTRLI